MADQSKTQNNQPAGPAVHNGVVPRLGLVDAWMEAHPWHPRILPYVVYMIMFSVIDLARGWEPRTYPFLYTLQCGLVIWVMWRYRRLLAELNLRFHWLAIPFGVGVFVVWIALGWIITGEYSVRMHGLLNGHPLGAIDYTGNDKPYFATDAAHGPYDFRDPALMGPTIGWASLILRLIGMSLVVPLFEELFIRSLLLRSFHSFRRTGIGIIQLVQDFPLLGDWLLHTHWGRRAGRHPPVFGPEFEKTPLGELSFFGVAASTFIFIIHHHWRDWPACIFCGVAYCFLLRLTRHKGLGPVVWAHGITNALIWWYTLQTNDWQFL